MLKLYRRINPSLGYFVGTEWQSSIDLSGVCIYHQRDTSCLAFGATFSRLLVPEFNTTQVLIRKEKRHWDSKCTVISKPW